LQWFRASPVTVVFSNLAGWKACITLAKPSQTTANACAAGLNNGQLLPEVSDALLGGRMPSRLGFLCGYPTSAVWKWLGKWIRLTMEATVLRALASAP
jgi:hypothetical protein